jgi:hypothetical protein
LRSPLVDIQRVSERGAVAPARRVDDLDSRITEALTSTPPGDIAAEISHWWTRR